jgi:PBP1b-binding outer membrane lipoprotein LpoB
LPYLAVKKVKGRYYGYLQESYREGGHVRTRTVEYLGAMEPAVAAQVQATRKRLGQADMAALVQSVREASKTATRAPETTAEPQKQPIPDIASKPPEPRYKRMTVNGRLQLVDTKTGELIEPEDKPVITTEPEKPTLRPFKDALKFPADLGKHRVGLQALQATHRKFGQRLKALRINPATMPNVTIEYGHPDGLKRERDGSYTVTTSRQKRQVRATINKRRLWDHTRQAMSRAMLDAIEAEKPALFAELQSELDANHKDTKQMLFELIAQTPNPTTRLALSLQLMIWNKIPRDLRAKTEANDLGQMSFDTVNDWRGDAALILADAQKSGWAGLADRQANTRKKLKAMITRRKNDLAEMNTLQRLSASLSGKRRKIIRDIMATETKLRAHEELTKRINFVRKKLDPPAVQKPWQAMNDTRSDIRKTTGENLPDQNRYAGRDHETDGIIWHVKKDVGEDREHRIYDQAGRELKWKHHRDKPKP